ncbi:MAG: bifunctional phosphoserine phosphatase/homoserine phosphotransferase ThrH [Desulfobacteraceae bacterium]|nr:bifunctional phosphoserine phosphatase/homoserine phosphotransferase ThrH [Desulfobacteraceae bacterium]
MKLFCADLEGVFLPEVWIEVALKVGIEELKLTTRDIADYDILMKKRLSILNENNLKIQDIVDVISKIDPLEGAIETLDWIRERTQIIVLSDTFEEFAKPMMKKLNFPALLCHSLTIDNEGTIQDYNIRIDSQKKKAVQAFKNMNYNVTAFGDSYNDTQMILEADNGFFYNPPESVVRDFPIIPVTKNYNEVKTMIESFL